VRSEPDELAPAAGGGLARVQAIRCSLRCKLFTLLTASSVGSVRWRYKRPGTPPQYRRHVWLSTTCDRGWSANASARPTRRTSSSSSRLTSAEPGRHDGARSSAFELDSISIRPPGANQTAPAPRSGAAHRVRRRRRRVPRRSCSRASVGSSAMAATHVGHVRQSTSTAPAIR